MMCAFLNRLRRYCPLPESISSLSATIADTSEEKNATPLTIMRMAKTLCSVVSGDMSPYPTVLSVTTTKYS